MTKDQSDDRSAAPWLIDDPNQDYMRFLTFQKSENVRPANDNKALALDLIRGASDLAQYILGDPTLRRSIYYYAETTDIPVFRIGSMLCARRSMIDAWIDQKVQQRTAGHGGESQPPTNETQAEGRPKGDLQGAASDSLAAEYLVTAAEIASFLFGDPSLARRVYHLAATSNLPIYRDSKDGPLRARRSELEQWISNQEQNPRGGRK